MNKFPELKTLPTQEEINELKQRNAELMVQVEYWKDIAEDCAVADTKVKACQILEMAIQLNETPSQYLAEHNREVAAKAGMSGFIAGADWFCDDEIYKQAVLSAARQYSSKIKSGEVEI